MQFYAPLLQLSIRKFSDLQHLFVPVACISTCLISIAACSGQVQACMPYVIVQHLMQADGAHEEHRVVAVEPVKSWCVWYCLYCCEEHCCVECCVQHLVQREMKVDAYPFLGCIPV